MSQRPVKAWKVGLFFLVSVTALMAAAMRFMPQHYQVSRSVLIAAPEEVVFEAWADPRRWPAFLVWFCDVEPTAKVRATGVAGAPGAELHYEGERLGAGRFVLTEVTPPQALEFEAYMTGPDGEQRVGVHRVVIEGEGSATRVVWSMIGELGGGPLDRFAGGSRERLAVHDFDASLGHLKACLEGSACPEPGGAPAPPDAGPAAEAPAEK